MMHSIDSGQHARRQQPSMLPGMAEEQPSAADSSALFLVALEEKARRLMKRSRYDEAARAFREVVDTLQLQRQGRQVATITTTTCDDHVTREVGALEGIAFCLSQQLE